MPSMKPNFSGTRSRSSGPRTTPRPSRRSSPPQPRPTRSRARKHASPQPRSPRQTQKTPSTSLDDYSLRRPVAVFKRVVLIVQLGKPLSQGQFMPKTLVDAKGELPRAQLAGQHLPRKCLRGRFFAEDAAGCIEGESQLFERRRQELGNIVFGLSSGAGGQASQRGTVEAGHECVASSADDVVCASFADASEDCAVLQCASGEVGGGHLLMIPPHVLIRRVASPEALPAQGVARTVSGLTEAAQQRPILRQLTGYGAGRTGDCLGGPRSARRGSLLLLLAQVARPSTHVPCPCVLLTCRVCARREPDPRAQRGRTTPPTTPRPRSGKVQVSPCPQTASSEPAHPQCCTAR
ncbi:hypothetical protein BX257_1105 [Streptomyces sp. 3212.3]|nr:hypothetical protein BX257_1105 [Streptomyces sp. 3212.3]